MFMTASELDQTTLKNDRKVRLVVKKYANFKQNTYIGMKIQKQ